MILYRDNQWLAVMMYNADRLGGAPHFPSWYRWGYGWNYGRGYEPLTEEEKETAGLLLDQYRNGGSDGPVESDSE